MTTDLSFGRSRPRTAIDIDMLGEIRDLLAIAGSKEGWAQDADMSFIHRLTVAYDYVSEVLDPEYEASPRKGPFE